MFQSEFNSVIYFCMKYFSFSFLYAPKTLFTWCSSHEKVLTLKVPITTEQTTILFFFFSEKTSLDISCESSARQTIHMKCQDLFSLKNEKKIFECHLLQSLLGALWVNCHWTTQHTVKLQ